MAYFVKKRMKAILFVLPCTLVILALIIYPMVYSLYLSFTSYNLSIAESSHFIGLRHYKSILTDDRFWKSLQNTFFLVIVGGGMELTIGLGIAFLLNKNLKGNETVKTVIIVPMLMAPVLVAQMWKIMFMPRFGIINYLLQILGIMSREISWLSTNRLLGLCSIMIVDIWEWTPFVAIISFAGLQSMPQSPIEAARVDGANNFQMVKNIYVPLLRPIIIVIILMRCIDIYKMFDAVYVLTEGGPGYDTETLSYYIFMVGLKYFDIGHATALAYFTVIIISVVMTFFTSNLVKQTKGQG
jgi:multiple sugar transport system permease protein